MHLVEQVAVVELDVITDIRGVWLPHVPLAALTDRLEIALPTWHTFSKVSALVYLLNDLVYLLNDLVYFPYDEIRTGNQKKGRFFCNVSCPSVEASAETFQKRFRNVSETSKRAPKRFALATFFWTSASVGAEAVLRHFEEPSALNPQPSTLNPNRAGHRGCSAAPSSSNRCGGGYIPSLQRCPA